MKLNKNALRLKRENRDKLREIFETAYQSDLEKDAVRQYIQAYVGRSKCKRMAYVALTTGVTTPLFQSWLTGLPLDDPGIIGPALLATFLGGLVGYTLQTPLRDLAIGEIYFHARQDAMRNYPNLEGKVPK